MLTRLVASTSSTGVATVRYMLLGGEVMVEPLVTSISAKSNVVAHTSASFVTTRRRLGLLHAGAMGVASGGL